MDLIFHNGTKLLNKEHNSRKQYTDFLENMCGVKLHTYQKTFLDTMINQNLSEFNIYGDDFKIEFTPKNIMGYCCLLIKDFDENQNFEHEINIDFTKDELDQLISLLQIMRNKI
jgi:hypothetical protein